MSPETLAEATAILRGSGAWTVYLGHYSWLSRIYRPSAKLPELEARLGMIAACAGQLLCAALSRQRIEAQTVRVSLQSSVRHGGTSGTCTGPALSVSLLVECRADKATAQRCWENVMRDPLLQLVTRGFQPIEISLDVRAAIPAWIG